MELAENWVFVYKRVKQKGTESVVNGKVTDQQW